MKSQTDHTNVKLDPKNIDIVLTPLSTYASPAGVSLTFDEQNDRFILSWQDFVANDWQETYNSLSHALMRMAVLARCAESGWELGFINDNDSQFGLNCETFLGGETA